MYVSFAWILQRPLRSPLAAPIENGHGKAPRTQVAHGLEIFFDEFRPARKQAHRALAAGRGLPARKPQRYPDTRLQVARHGALGHGVGGNADERHGREEILGLFRRWETVQSGPLSLILGKLKIPWFQTFMPLAAGEFASHIHPVHAPTGARQTSTGAPLSGANAARS